MKITITLDLDEQDRIGIANYYEGCKDGDNLPAELETCKEWIIDKLGYELTLLPFED